MRKILITTSTFGKIDAAPLEKLKKEGCEVVLNPYGRKLTTEEAAALLCEHKPSALIAGVETLDEAVLNEAASWLKVISRCGIGLESVDLEAAKKLNIKVTNTPDAPTVPVAELTLGLILCSLRGLHRSDASIREGGWERPMGSLLSGKTVGIIGCGRIGKCLAHLLKAFQCRVLGYDPANPRSPHYDLAELEELFAVSDIVTLHMPLGEDCYHFMNRERIMKMKKGSLLVNASRGGLVDEGALYDALKSKHLSAAALDTFEQEPYRGSLKELENVLLTGHIGSYAHEARVMMEMQAVDNLLEHL